MFRDDEISLLINQNKDKWVEWKTRCITLSIISHSGIEWPKMMRHERFLKSNCTFLLTVETHLKYDRKIGCKKKKKTHQSMTENVKYIYIYIMRKEEDKEGGGLWAFYKKNYM